jgi:hypothetical protein
VEYPYIRNVYYLFGTEDSVKNVHLAEEAHDYGPSKRTAAYKFIAMHLKLSLEILTDPNMSGGIDESGVKIEKQEIMRVFDAGHPRPGHALLTDEAISKALTGR